MKTRLTAIAFIGLAALAAACAPREAGPTLVEVTPAGNAAVIGTR